MRLVLAVVCCFGCATPTRPLSSNSDLSPAEVEALPDLAEAAVDLSRREDLAQPPEIADLASSPDLAPLPDLSVVSCTFRINEVATGTTASGYQEFVELYNPCDQNISLSQHQLVYRSAAGNVDSVLVADLGATLAKKGFLVWAGNGYYASVRQATMTSGLAEPGGGVAVRDATGRIVDSLGWGTATNAFVVGDAAPAPGDRAAPGRSVARNPNVVSQGDNALDFAITNQPTPGAANVIN